MSKINPERKSGVLQVIQEKSIEEDVKQNKEDIIDLRVNDGPMIFSSLMEWQKQIISTSP